MTRSGAGRAVGGLALGLLVLAGGLVADVHAQTPTIRQRLEPAEARVGDTVRLILEVDSSEPARIVPPELADFEVLGQELVQVGGSRFTLILRPRRAGRLRIEGARLRLRGGGEVTANATTLVVREADPNAAPAPSPGLRYPSLGGIPGIRNPLSRSPATRPPDDLAPPEGLDGATYDPVAFLRTVVDERNPYVGQQATVSLYLYVRGDIQQPVFTQEPTAEGFWMQNLLPLGPVPDTSVRIGRERFRAFLLRRFAAFPFQAGPHRIGAPEIAVDVLRGPFAIGRSVERIGQEVTLDVRELPAAGRPPGEIYVGTLQLRAEAQPAQVEVGGTASFVVRATGEGRLSSLQLELREPSGLRALPPTTEDDLQTGSGRVGGTREKRWLLVAREPGTYELPAFEVATFDPTTATYRVVRSEAVTVVVTGAAPTPAPQEEEEPEAEEAPTSFGTLRSRAVLSRDRTRWFEGPALPFSFFLGPLLLLAAFGARGLGRRRQVARAQRGKPSRREARRRLAEAERLATGEDAGAFYGAIERALRLALEAKLGEPTGSFTRRDLAARLRERGMEEETAERLLNELEGCDFARFSAVGVSADERARCLDRTRALLDGLDRFQPRDPDEGRVP